MVLMARPLDLIKITDLKGCQHATALNSSFQEHYNNLKNNDHNIVDIYFDGKGGIDSIKD